MDNRRKIIMVDDVGFSLVKIKQQLKDNYEIFTVNSAAKMFEIIKSVKPDLILLDINMPDMDGYEAIKELKANAFYADIPVIFLTGRIDEDSVIKGLSLGAADYITKPVSYQLLVECIEGALSPFNNLSSENTNNKDDDKKPCILAVDDSPPMLRSINYALRNKYKVFTLPKPENLRMFLEKETPDLFLLDINMPLLSGLELIPIIREFEIHQKTPIIMLTSDGTNERLASAVNMGACDYIVKPFTPRILRSKINKHIKT